MLRVEFANEKHKRNFDTLCIMDSTYDSDYERKTLFYILSGNTELYNIAEKLYDIESHSIKIRSINKAVLSSSAKKLLLVGLNLYNNYKNTNSILDTFACLDENNFFVALQAIKIRFFNKSGF